MYIKPKVLIALRKQKHLSRNNLAERSNVSSRQISRYEKSADSSVKIREHTMIQLAKALKVDQRVLTGEIPLPKNQKKDNETKRVTSTTSMTNSTRLNYALIKRRYGINPTTIINIAPLFFIILAEKSLTWRRKKLAKFYDAAKQIHNLSKGSDYFSFVNSIYRAEDGAMFEEKSIDNLDLFGKNISDDTFDLGYDPDVSNPFADYLTKLVDEVGKPELIKTDDYIENAPIKGFPEHEICSDELNYITNGSGIATLALRCGYVLLSDIPSNLWAEGRDNDRAQWIEEQAPQLKEGFDNLNFDLDIEIPSHDKESENGSE